LLENARDQTRATIDEARQAVWDLRSTPAAGGIGQRLAETAQQLSQQFGVPIDCDTTGVPATVDPETGHHLLLVVREALNNAVRHGRPGRVSVRLHGENGTLRVHIQDDGCGFVPEAASQPGAAHYGIVGMRERIESLGGTFALDSAPGRGTGVEITLPLEPRKPHHRVHSDGTVGAGKGD